MPVAVPIALGLTAASSVYSGYQQKKGAKAAAFAQNAMDQQAIAEQQRQFDALQSLMSPYVQAGAGSLGAQQNLLGLNGNAKQQSAYDAIQNSAGFQSQLAQGQNAMLQSASATGGLRGGNTQAAMAQFAPALLNQAIASQYTNLGGMTSLGQNSAAMQGNAGMQSANAIGSLYQSQGANTAGYQLARAQANSNMVGGLTSLGTTALMGGFGSFGGSSTPTGGIGNTAKGSAYKGAF